MTYEKLNRQIDAFGPQDVEAYARGCRRVAVVSLVLAPVFLVLAQALTFFVALETSLEPGGYTFIKSLILALTPVAGPVFALVQMLMAGLGRPLLLLPLLLPALLLLLLAANRRDAYKKASWALASHTPDDGDEPLMTLPELHDILQSAPVNLPEARPAAGADIKTMSPEETVRLEPNLSAPVIIKASPVEETEVRLPAVTGPAASAPSPTVAVKAADDTHVHTIPAAPSGDVAAESPTRAAEPPAVQNQIQDVLSLLDKYKAGPDSPVGEPPDRMSL